MTQIVVQECYSQFDKPLIYWLLRFAEFPTVVSSGLKRGALAGILVGTIVAAIAVSVVSTVFIMKKRRKHRTVSRRSRKSNFLFPLTKNEVKFPCAASKMLPSDNLKSLLLYDEKEFYEAIYMSIFGKNLFSHI
jgi:hypothetical protein